MNANIRVYGWLENRREEVLLVRERFMGQKVTKFPGGGLEPGEGLADCLVREFYEELNLHIQIRKHIYTQDFYQKSVLPKRGQLLVVFYAVEAMNLTEIKIRDLVDAQLLWVHKECLGNYLELPVDKAMLNSLL